MSSTLTWRPTPKLKESKSLPDELKFILRNNDFLPKTFTVADYDYLLGLVHAKVKGAKELMDLIKIHESVDVQEEF